MINSKNGTLANFSGAYNAMSYKDKYYNYQSPVLNNSAINI